MLIKVLYQENFYSTVKLPAILCRYLPIWINDKLGWIDIQIIFCEAKGGRASLEYSFRRKDGEAIKQFLN